MKPYFPLIAILFLLLGCKPVPLVMTDFDLSKIPAGTFTGTAKHINVATVKIMVKSGKIAGFEIVELDATPYGQKAKDSIGDRILEQQTPYVDAVSGATEASHTLINATVNALSKAKNERGIKGSAE